MFNLLSFILGFTNLVHSFLMTFPTAGFIFFYLVIDFWNLVLACKIFHCWVVWGYMQFLISTACICLRLSKSDEELFSSMFHRKFGSSLLVCWDRKLKFPSICWLCLALVRKEPPLGLVVLLLCSVKVVRRPPYLIMPVGLIVKFPRIRVKGCPHMLQCAKFRCSKPLNFAWI